MPSHLQIIAERLNISTATVSRALNGKPGVSVKVRNSVLVLAEELNIFTSPLVQKITPSHAMAIAFVARRQSLSSIDEAFYNKIMKGAEQELSRHGYHLVTITIEIDRPNGVQFPPNLDKNRLDGLLVGGPELSGEVIDKLKALGLPIVLCANRDPLVDIDSVTSANKEGAMIAVGHLHEHGHSHIGCISGPMEWSPVGDRVDGYLEAMRARNFPTYVYCCSDYLTTEAGYDLTSQLLSEHPETTAIFAANDPMAVGAINAAREIGRKVPADLAIVGYDNIYLSELFDPPLTTVYIHKEQIGVLAARRLYEIIQLGPQIPIDVRVKNELVIRQSCGCTAFGDENSHLNGY